MKGCQRQTGSTVRVRGSPGEGQTRDQASAMLPGCGAWARPPLLAGDRANSGWGQAGPGETMQRLEADSDRWKEDWPPQGSRWQ